MSIFELYIWTRLDAIGCVFVGFGFISAIAAIVFGAVWGYSRDCLKFPSLYELEPYKAMISLAKRWLKVTIPLSAFCLVMAALIPSKQDAALIYGMHWATNNTDLQAIPDEAAETLRAWLQKAKPEQDTTRKDKP